MLVPRLDLGRIDLVLRCGPNWIAALFFAAMSILHLAIAIPDLADGAVESQIGLGLGVLFLLAALACWRVRRQVALYAADRMMHVSYWLGREWFTRRIAFEQVRAVKLTLKSKRARARIQICCLKETIECPVTTVPRQQALCMAITMGARLIKIIPDQPFAIRNRISGLPFDAMAGDEPNH